ncbi:MAG: 30S ribosomal protein S6 [Anaerolineae bacterium]|jgi:small subunit ribosomal protein S6|nr:30S ribosomal protein S6 [Anaerolineae bacterium]
MKRPYEVTVVLRILSNEEETQAAINQVIAYIEAGTGDAAAGKVNRIDRTTLGRRKLAYEIDGQRDGIYVIFYADIEPKSVTELDLNLKLYNPALRHLVIRVEPERMKAAKAAKAAKAEAAKAEAPAAEATPAPETPAAPAGGE